LLFAFHFLLLVVKGLATKFVAAFSTLRFVAFGPSAISQIWQIAGSGMPSSPRHLGGLPLLFSLLTLEEEPLRCPNQDTNYFYSVKSGALPRFTI